jgi:hypothetical protein
MGVDPAQVGHVLGGQVVPGLPGRAVRLVSLQEYQNIGRDYDAAIRHLHSRGVMVNGSYVFGMDDDGPDVFDKTVEWAIGPGHRNGDLSYPDAVPRYRLARKDGGRGTP